MELTTTSVQSTNYQAPVTEQPNRLSRWWTRHYRHIGLASTAGSAILVCIIAIILLPIVIHHASKEKEPCTTTTQPWPGPPTTMTSSSTISTSLIGSSTLSTTTPIVPTDLLCAANATWKTQAVTVAGLSNGTNSSTSTGLDHPNDILVEPNGNLFIADLNNNRVVYWPSNATEGRIVAGRGIFGSWINLFKYPAAIIAWKNQLFVSDLENYRILVFPLNTNESSPDGNTIIGRYGAGSDLNQINYVYYMALDSRRELLYLSDSQNSRILRLNLTDYSVELAVGTRTNGSDNLSLNYPLGITIDEITSTLYVADTYNHRIQKFDFNSSQGSTVAGGINSGQNLSQLYLPSGIALDPTGNLYIADSGNHRIVQWLIGAQQGSIIAGTGIAGTNPFQLDHPVQLKFDIHHNLYIVDQNNNRIQRFDLFTNGC